MSEELLCPICNKSVQSINVTPDCQHTTKEIFDYARALQAEMDRAREVVSRLRQEVEKLQLALPVGAIPDPRFDPDFENDDEDDDEDFDQEDDR